ncbi:MAG: histidinol phosphate phosphatase [Deltaproteobacteria bacterium SG8_13]|nr:MAG: histidinol phosphate phosphatase [Deltaproteobacteria bacterium SG8_13]
MAAAYRGAEVLRAYFGKNPAVQKKSAIDLVTEADTASEEAIVKVIRSRFPDHAVLAEEGGWSGGERELRWIIDPLDGTTNFAHQVPIYAVSIGFAWSGRIVAGVVLNPCSGELFTATAEERACLNGRPIRVSSVATLEDSLLVTGFPYNVRDLLPDITRRMQNCLRLAQGVRRLGSAALDLCYVACGRFEGFWEQYLKPWDTAAGICIAEAAGAVITDFSSQPYPVGGEEILATNGRIHAQMIAALELRDTE